MARILFTHERGSGGTILRLMEKRWHSHASPIPVAAWADRMADQAFSGISRILALADDVESAVEDKGDSLFIDHKTIASLSEPQALGLDLPPSVRFALQLNTKNLVTDHDFGIFGRWVDEANRSLRVERNGAFLFVEGREYRLPEPLFSLVSAIDAFASDDTRDNDIRMERLADLQLLLPQEVQKQLSIDSYFSSFRVMHASAFSLSLRIEGRSFDFDPVLFGRRVIEQHRAEDGPVGPVSEAEGLLTEHQQGVFARDRFRSSDDVKSSYLIERGIYLHLDSSLRSAMSVVRQMQRANAETRRRFVQAPQLYLKEALSKILADDEVERLFIETEQYSARVIDIGVWTPPVIPWVKKEPNDWLPEKFGLKVGNQYIVLTSDDVAPLREMIKEAREGGKDFVEFGEDKIRITSTVEAEQSLSRLLGAIKPSLPPGNEPDLAKPSEERLDQKRVLIVEENFDKLGFIRKITPRKRAIPSLPAAIRPSLMKHQQSGLDWMQETWTRGYAGALLADDMGLGKTLQALAFLAWLREVAAANRLFGVFKGPIIIVAPTGLLANWEKEHDNHLHDPGLGEICRAYGRHLKILKTVSTRDIDRGAPSLDRRRIQQARSAFSWFESYQAASASL